MQMTWPVKWSLGKCSQTKRQITLAITKEDPIQFCEKFPPKVLQPHADCRHAATLQKGFAGAINSFWCEGK